MKSIRYILLFGLLTLIFFGCSSTKNVTKLQLEDKWVLKSMNNRPVSEIFPERTPYITFNFSLNQVSGNSGCNTFNGIFTYNDGKFKAPNLASTMMACESMDMESQFQELLKNESKLSIMNGDLIFSQDSKPVLIFSRSQPLGAADLSGAWRLQSIDGSSADSEFKINIPTLNFDFGSNKLTGNAGCNTFNSSFSLSKNVIDVSPLITTRMACDDLDSESKFVKLLAGRAEVELVNGELIFMKENKTILTFVR